ncbi:MAG TPA: desulfoferrodoxin [candidate division Zixibacteria bacterium]|nr:desulfoferrodoxin [candidate division Zixibacteria bacterium]
MAEKLQIYKCEKCGNIIEVVHGGQGALVCCGEPMKLLKEQTADWKNEKHVPVIEQLEEGKIKVVVGSTPHPMTDEHYIEWIEVIQEGKAYRKFLKPGDDPKAKFKIKGEGIIAREYCNKHGLWKN